MTVRITAAPSCPMRPSISFREARDLVLGTASSPCPARYRAGASRTDDRSPRPRPVSLVLTGLRRSRTSRGQGALSRRPRSPRSRAGPSCLIGGAVRSTACFSRYHRGLLTRRARRSRRAPASTYRGPPRGLRMLPKSIRPRSGAERSEESQHERRGIRRCPRRSGGAISEAARLTDDDDGLGRIAALRRPVRAATATVTTYRVS